MTHVIITLGYPAARAFIAERNKLQLFTDAMTIIAMAMIIGGIVYALVLRGDFDISAFVMRRGMKRDDMQFLGILYLIVSAVIAYGFL